jgi:chromosome segregation ATPase
MKKSGGWTMSDKLLKQILEELKGIKNEQQIMKEQLNKTNQIVRTLRDGQEELKAQMEGLSLDVHKLHGELTATRREHQRDRDISDMRAGRTEREILEINSRLEQLERREN